MRHRRVCCSESRPTGPFRMMAANACQGRPNCRALLTFLRNSSYHTDISLDGRTSGSYYSSSTTQIVLIIYCSHQLGVTHMSVTSNSKGQHVKKIVSDHQVPTSATNSVSSAALTRAAKPAKLPADPPAALFEPAPADRFASAIHPSALVPALAA